MDSTVGGPAFSASQQVADMVNAVVEGTAASLDAYHSFLAQHLPPSEVAPDALAQGLDNTSQRIAVHADACLSRFEQWALESVFARPAALDEHAAQQAAASTAFTREEESELDARLQAARCRLAAAHASAEAMRSECSSLDAELTESQTARAQLDALAAAAGSKENAAATCTQLVVALADFVPLLDTAEALASQGTAACGTLALPEAPSNGTDAWRAAMPTLALPDMAAFNARMHR